MILLDEIWLSRYPAFTRSAVLVVINPRGGWLTLWWLEPELELGLVDEDEADEASSSSTGVGVPGTGVRGDVRRRCEVASNGMMVMLKDQDVAGR